MINACSKSCRLIFFQLQMNANWNDQVTDSELNKLSKLNRYENITLQHSSFAASHIAERLITCNVSLSSSVCRSTANLALHRITEL